MAAYETPRCKVRLDTVFKNSTGSTWKNRSCESIKSSETAFQMSQQKGNDNNKSYISLWNGLTTTPDNPLMYFMCRSRVSFLKPRLIITQTSQVRHHKLLFFLEKCIFTYFKWILWVSQVVNLSLNFPQFSALMRWNEALSQVTSITLTFE